MKITGKFRDPLTRQANEAVRISQRSKNTGELLNSKSEFNHPPLGRVAVEKRRYGQNNWFKKKLIHHNNFTLKYPIVIMCECLFLFGTETEIQTQPDGKYLSNHQQWPGEPTRKYYADFVIFSLFKSAVMIKSLNQKKS